MRRDPMLETADFHVLIVLRLLRVDALPLF